MKKLLLLVSLTFLIGALKAQQGAPLLTNFKESSEIENQNWAICHDDKNVMMFANRRGITHFLMAKSMISYWYLQFPILLSTILSKREYMSEERTIMGISNGMIREYTDTSPFRGIPHL